ncbi:TerC family protein [Thalassobacillus sp. CUG 92003]|uniref:TerC family protein n=1 Tax=Thalassobacillus sp. CUG 92003 TaxID=2736641 RepID=UPI0015E71759|nr:TerC family protein [Thalassobacillus sp. CUG 92003]
MEWEVIQAILIIIGIDLVLGGDNAIVIALACRNLPEHQRNKAILLGTGLAIAMRVLLTALALYLLHIPLLKLFGGLLLVQIAINLVRNNNEEVDIKAGSTLLSAVKTIVFADIVMGFDNVLAIAGASRDNMWLVIAGLLISIPIIIWGSKIILWLMERLPVLIYIGAGIIAYTAGKMVVEEQRLHSLTQTFESLHLLIPLVFIIVVILSGYFSNKKQAPPVS